MIRSMTAFARQESELATGILTLELRSVNHRFLEMAVRLPEELRAMETMLRESAGRRLRRGKLDCNLRFRPVESRPDVLAIDEHHLARVMGAFASIAARLEDSAPINPVDIMRWPGVMREEETDSTALQEEVKASFMRALDELVATREREGSQIYDQLSARLSAIEPLVSEVRQRIPEIKQRIRVKLGARVSELVSDINQDRLEQELVYIAQKLDVDEELDRLSGHVEEARRVLGKDEPVGRRLDFLMQEFNREANTLASKSADTETTRIAVELKVLIEQMREQVQNVE